MHSRQLPDGGSAAQLCHHVSAEVVRVQLVTQKVRQTNPDLCQQPITARVRGQEDRVQATRLLQELREQQALAA